MSAILLLGPKAYPSGMVQLNPDTQHVYITVFIDEYGCQLRGSFIYSQTAAEMNRIPSPDIPCFDSVSSLFYYKVILMLPAGTGGATFNGKSFCSR
jgi:hypothetical protein